MKKKMVKLTAILCLLAMVLGLAACTAQDTPADSPSPSAEQSADVSPSAGSSPSEAPAANTEKSDETLVVALTLEPATMYPNTPVSNTSAMSICRVVYNRLTELDPDTSELVPSLAESWEWVDETHLRMFIRQGVKDFYGNELTANDVMYTFKTAQENSSSISGYLSLEETVVEDDYTIVIGLSSPDAGFPYLVANVPWSIISQSATEASGGLEATFMNPNNGTGKYKPFEWKSGEYVTVERNEDYWDGDYAGYYKYIKYVFIADPSARMLAAQSGDVDIAVTIGIAQAQTVASSDTVRSEITAAGCVSNLIVNCAAEPFSNQNVREAMRLLIDGEVINQAINMGASELQSPWLSKNHPYYYDTLADVTAPERSAAIEEAKQLLADAGYPNGLTFDCSIMQMQESLYTILQSMFAEGGITMKLNITEQSVWVGELRSGAWTLVDCASLGTMYGQTLLPELDPNQVGKTLTSIGYTDPEYAKVVQTAVSETDEAKAKEAYIELQKMIYDKCLVLCSYEQVYAAVLDKNIDGMYPMIRSTIYDVSDVRPIA